jgi:putative transposase
MAIREKTHRLHLENYVGFKIISFTCCVSDKQHLFINNHVFIAFEAILLDSLNKHDCGAHAYIFMPDHGHMILQGKSEIANIWKCMVAFKQKTGFWLSRNAPDFQWQKDFYDHVLRKEEDLKKHIEYVLYNPVRKGLVENWKEYPYKGSTIYDFDSWE